MTLLDLESSAGVSGMPYGGLRSAVAQCGLRFRDLIKGRWGWEAVLGTITGALIQAKVIQD